MKVQEILMTKSPQFYVIQPHALVREAARLMAEHNIGAVMVVDENNKLIGIVSERDIVREAVHVPTPLFEKTVGSIMTTQLIVALPDDELGYVINAMMEKNIRHLPVVDGERILGLLSIKDVVKALQRHYVGEITQLHYLADMHL